MSISARARRNIHMRVQLFTTHANKPDEDDRVKLKCVLKYLKAKMKLKLTLSVGDMSMVKLWIYASYTV